MIHRGSTDLGFDSGSLLHWDKHQTVILLFSVVLSFSLWFG